METSIWVKPSNVFIQSLKSKNGTNVEMDLELQMDLTPGLRTRSAEARSKCGTIKFNVADETFSNHSIDEDKFLNGRPNMWSKAWTWNLFSRNKFRKGKNKFRIVRYWRQIIVKAVTAMEINNTKMRFFSDLSRKNYSSCNDKLWINKKPKNSYKNKANLARILSVVFWISLENHCWIKIFKIAKMKVFKFMNLNQWS